MDVLNRFNSLRLMDIPSFETTCRNKFSFSIPKIYIFGLREMPYFLQCSNIILRGEICAFISLETIVKSSWYISMIFPITSQKEKSMALWKLDPTFIMLKGIHKYMKVPQGVVNVGLSRSTSLNNTWLYP